MKLELLAPARNLQVGIEAIRHGADAVYIGGPGFGARAAAGNSIDDIARLCDFAHIFHARVYVTLNTIIYDNELDDVRSLIRNLWRVGVDALIVQDMAILELDIPPIPIHASTQCDTRNHDKARFLADAGFSQIVLPREMSLNEIADIRHALPDNVQIEAFVHGALCVSYSGDCQAGQMAMGRSANRGQCPQMCRLPYTLTDANGRVILRDKHLLSLRDLCRIRHLRDMADAGVSSFKIEGRLKDVGYVRNVTAAYRQALDQVIADSDGRYSRASDGDITLNFTPDVRRSFNRGFTTYFLRDITPRDIASLDTPKMTGTPVAVVDSVRGNRITLRDLRAPLSNGDGLGHFDPSGQFDGFRVNRVVGNVIHTLRPVRLNPGDTLYRNFDRLWDDTINAPDTARRKIPVSVTLSLTPHNRAVATAGGVSVSFDPGTEQARTPQQARRRDIITKTGDTPYTVTDVIDNLGDIFIPPSLLTTVRRDLFDLLTAQRLATRPLELRRPDRAAAYPADTLTYHHNVANTLAGHFYTRHGVTDIQPAAEITPPPVPMQVMQTRYCLRRQLGACLRQGGDKRLPGPLHITTGTHRYLLRFDCDACRMTLHAL